ncbi:MULTISPECIES: ABC transporter permease [unclassified Sphingomonas]|uniref:ABC transporter permease n=1 Tax=unclassified Sphingomonas TaxID=196159 RepID=UPI002150AF1C|nr:MULTISPECIES: ABC transporter permease [unclassified Sphingomonas]MCR5870644.1 ABC transporter permease [Sphingomonas sp. J344]UUY01017.1 ABC transporter permease [Sphingomonas sp. J315]
MSAPADFQHDTAEGALRFSGNLSLRSIGDLPTRLGAVEGDVRTLDMRGIERIDTVGAWLIHRFARDHDAQVTGLDANQQLLFDHVAQADHPIEGPPKPMGAFAQLLAEIGEAVVQAFQTMYGLLGFMGATAVAAGRVIANPRRFRYHATVHRFEVVGVSALGIIGLMSFLIGIVIAQQGAVQLRQFGAEVFTINLVGRITLRELGILMTAIMVAGRSGSAFAAQLGTMKLTEEIDAMRTIGVNPMEALVLPRVIAAVLMLPLLGFYASLLGMIGGGLLCWIALDIPPITFVQRLREVVPITDLYVGLVKAPVFGAIIAIAGCYQGMQVESDAEQVGMRTTTAVVQAIFLVIVLDAFFAVFFTEVGWN